MEELEIMRSFGFMLAEEGEPQAALNDNRVISFKYDGERAQMIYYAINGQMKPLIEYKNRRGNCINLQFPDLKGIKLKAMRAVLDGEIWIPKNVNIKGRPTTASRSNLQNSTKIRLLSALEPAVFTAFDILYLDGKDLRGLPLEDRIRILNEVVVPSEHLDIAPCYYGAEGRALFETVKAAGGEGVMAKLLGSKYQEKRSSSWWKCKLWKECDLAVIGFTSNRSEYGEGRDVSALVLTGGLKVNFGVSDALYDRVAPLLKGAVVGTQSINGDMVKLISAKMKAKVKYLEKSENGLFRFPILRDLEVGENV